MTKFRLTLSSLAIVFATFAAYSFAEDPAKNESMKPSPNVDYWIKYDCRVNPDVTIVTTGNNYTMAAQPTGLPGYSTNCPGTLSVCARRYAAADVEDDPANPGNKRPKEGREESFTDFKQCVTIAP